MTHTITITRCLDCPLYASEDIDDCTPDMCLHDDSGWDKQGPYCTVYPSRVGIPSNCPLLQTPVTYRAERKGE